MAMWYFGGFSPTKMGQKKNLESRRVPWCAGYRRSLVTGASLVFARPNSDDGVHRNRPSGSEVLFAASYTIFPAPVRGTAHGRRGACAPLVRAVSLYYYFSGSLTHVSG